jgi:hypothetical protein
MKYSHLPIVGILLALPVTGICQTAPHSAPAAAPHAAAAPHSGGAPAQNAAPGMGDPVTGKVLQTMNSGGYSYVLVKKANGDRVWVAMSQTEIVVGDEMTFAPGMTMYDFPSKTLNRTFKEIVFSNGPIPGPATKKGKKDAKKSPGSKGAAAAGEKIKVAEATGRNAYRVADIFRLRIELHKRSVTVRGKVVKVSAGIMDRNWIHIQDGTGDAKKGTNDLVVTSTSALPSVGDVVTVKGTAYKNRDFGANYKYDVIVEDADVTIE